MKIIIVGAGWYGLHTYCFLKKNFKNKIDIIILEKETKIFNNSSNYNQNRLHLGYHYPRSHKTRELCLIGYYKFIQEYRELVDFIDSNYYLISNDSIIDYNTYLKIFDTDKYNHNIIKNNIFINIEGNIINTQEKIINSEKVVTFFKKKINKEDLKLDYKVNSISLDNKKIIINNKLECDLLIDCTYNQLNLSKHKYSYEITISLLYDRINFDDNFDSITVMDGLFFSLFPRNINKQTYTLTHVLYTPVIISNNIEDINNYNIQEENVLDIKEKMTNDVLKIYPNFQKSFIYKSYFLSYKCKLISNNQTRECIIEENNNIINVNCGKITGIYELEIYLKNKFNII